MCELLCTIIVLWLAFVVFGSLWEWVCGVMRNLRYDYNQRTKEYIKRECPVNKDDYEDYPHY